MKAQTSDKAVRESFVPPMMGETVDEVLRAFIRLSDDWVGIKVLEAFLPVTNEGGCRRYRVNGRVFGRKGTRIGVSLEDGLCLRDATEREEAELEESLSQGFVQITASRRGQPVEVLHQATGKPMAMQSESAAG